MKGVFIIIFFFALLCVKAQTFKVDSWSVRAQSMNVDSLEILLTKTKNDTLKTKILNELSLRYAFNEPEKGLSYSEQGLVLAQKFNYKDGIADANQSQAYCLWAMGNYSNSLQLALSSLHQYEDLKDWERIAWMYLTLAIIYRDITDYKNAWFNANKGMRLYDSLHLSLRIPFAVIGSIYEKQNQLDSALTYTQKARELDLKETGGKWGWLYTLLGNIYTKKGHYDIALVNYRNALPLTVTANIKKDIVDIYNSLATLYKTMGKVDSSIYYASEILQKFSATSYQKGVLEATNTLAEMYKIKNQRDSIIKYLELSVALHNKLFNQEKEREIQSLAFTEQRRQQEQAEQQREFQNKIKLYSLLAALVIFLIIAFLLFRNNQHKQKAYSLLQKQKKETDIQKAKVEDTLEELKSTQAQLIQSEKMASLGELTAGIAHEIQNPLNFVNNFSEVNRELINELVEEVGKGNTEEVKAIANDIKDNEEKINHHGKRADAIVKGMLQHSRQTKGVKEPTDINALCDEYLRISYHGLRAKDKNFNADFKTDFDESIGKINIVPQDMGRVLLNLYNNAFYAVNEKSKMKNEKYELTVSVTTKKIGNSVFISVSDNGNGISQNIVDKIFQPFFTTKPTGEGTGLGLSLAYDIITKEHNGSIKVESEVGNGSTFIVQLPFI